MQAARPGEDNFELLVLGPTTTHVADVSANGACAEDAGTQMTAADLKDAHENLTANEDGINMQELPPVDGGVKAWSFCASAFFVETMVWGYSFR